MYVFLSCILWEGGGGERLWRNLPYVGGRFAQSGVSGHRSERIIFHAMPAGTGYIFLLLTILEKKKRKKIHPCEQFLFIKHKRRPGNKVFRRENKHVFFSYKHTVFVYLVLFFFPKKIKTAVNPCQYFFILVSYRISPFFLNYFHELCF